MMSVLSYLFLRDVTLILEKGGPDWYAYTAGVRAPQISLLIKLKINFLTAFFCVYSQPLLYIIRYILRFTIEDMLVWIRTKEASQQPPLQTHTALVHCLCLLRHLDSLVCSNKTVERSIPKISDNLTQSHSLKNVFILCLCTNLEVFQPSARIWFERSHI